MYVCMYVCMCVYVLCIFVCACIDLYIYIYLFIDMSKCVYLLSVFVNVCMDMDRTILYLLQVSKTDLSWHQCQAAKNCKLVPKISAVVESLPHLLKEAPGRAALSFMLRGSKVHPYGAESTGTASPSSSDREVAKSATPHLQKDWRGKAKDLESRLEHCSVKASPLASVVKQPHWLRARSLL